MNLKRNHKNKKHTQYYANSINENRKYPRYADDNSIHLPSLIYKPKNLVDAELTLRTRKLLKAAGYHIVAASCVSSEHKVVKINPRSKTDFTGYIKIGSTQVLLICNTNDLMQQLTMSLNNYTGTSMYFEYDGREYYYYKGKIQETIFSRASTPVIENLDTVDFHTQDEALIFQYNTLFDYNLFRSVHNIVDDLQGKEQTPLNIYQSTIKVLQGK